MGEKIDFPLIVSTNYIGDSLKKASERAIKDCAGSGFALVVWDDSGKMNVNWDNQSPIPNRLIADLVRQGLEGSINSQLK